VPAIGNSILSFILVGIIYGLSFVHRNPWRIYHISSRGNERKAIFKGKQDRAKFLEYLGSATER
jgi:hypothetical protein